MMTTPPAEIGMALEDVDTPALLIDLDAYEENLRRMASEAEEAGVRLRPHAKMHKCAVIAHQQMELGAVGVCCQKVGEAEAMVYGGVPNVLVSNQVVGVSKLQRLMSLVRQAEVAVCADDAENVAQLSEAAEAAGVELPVYVELDVMHARCGVAAGEPARQLARVIDKAPGLRVAGLQAYHGAAQHIRPWEERRAAIAAASEACVETKSLLDQDGIPCEVVTGAGTGTYRFEAGSGIYNELQCGSYAFMDVDYGRNLAEDGGPFQDYEQALFVYSMVMSVPTRDRAVCDAGLKAMAFDCGVPSVAGDYDVEYLFGSDEHGTMRVRDTNRPLRLGDKIKLVPGHCDPTVNLHDWYVCVRDDRVESIWPIVARGAGR